MAWQIEEEDEEEDNYLLKNRTAEVEEPHIC